MIYNEYAENLQKFTPQTPPESRSCGKQNPNGSQDVLNECSLYFSSATKLFTYFIISANFHSNYIAPMR